MKQLMKGSGFFHGENEIHDMDEVCKLSGCYPLSGAQIMDFLSPLQRQQIAEILRTEEALKVSGRSSTSPRIVCLCGSTRFREAFQKAAYEEDHAGRIVLTVGCYKDDPCCKDPEDWRRLDKHHRYKIDLADEILVINVGGYVGDSTKSEILYATVKGKTVRWLEPDKALEVDLGSTMVPL
jgi:hypothetical protein